LLDLKSPYPLREGQDQLVQFIRGAVCSGSVCLAHAPTGIGKTLAALLGALPCVGEERKLLYSVNRKNQIPIILKEIAAINRANKTHYTAVSFASKLDLCRDEELRALGYSDFLRACELRRKSGSCPFFEALFEPGSRRAPAVLAPRRARSPTAVELEESVLNQMPPPHKVQQLAEKIEAENRSPPVCIYEILKAAAKRANVIIGTFWYFFHPDVSSSLSRALSLDTSLCVLICDEAHNLPRFCRQALSMSLSENRVRYARRELSIFSQSLAEAGLSPDGLADLLDKIGAIFGSLRFTPEGRHLPRGILRALLRHRGMDSLTGPVESLESSANVILMEKMRRGLEPTSHVATVASFLRPFLLLEDASFERFCSRTRSRSGRVVRRLEIRSLDPAPLASRILSPFSPTGVGASVLMSGTLVPGEYYKDILGIPGARHREFPNIFPKSNRALFLDDTISLAWRARSEATYRAVAERMEAIASNTPGGCMFFFPSYDVMRSVARLYKRDALIEKRGQTKGEEAERVLRLGGSVLAVMGATLSEGLDIPGAVKAAAVFGLPLEKISDEIKVGVAYYETKYPQKGKDYFYFLPAVTKIVQAIGRAHRSAEDRAALYVFDRRFCRYYLKDAPAWWREEAIRVRSIDELVTRTRQFWTSQPESIFIGGAPPDSYHGADAVAGSKNVHRGRVPPDRS